MMVSSRQTLAGFTVFVVVTLGVYTLLLDIQHPKWIIKKGEDDLDWQPSTLASVLDHEIIIDLDSEELQDDKISSAKHLDSDRGIAKNNTSSEYKEKEKSPLRTRKIKILFWHTLDNVIKPDFGFGLGHSGFLKHGCPVNTCTITKNKHSLNKSDAVLFNSFWSTARDLPPRPNLDQIWVFYYFESPFRSLRQVPGTNDRYNLTMTYLDDPDTDIRAGPGQDRLKEPVKPMTAKMFHQKSKMIAWVVSDCVVHSTRQEYVQELNKYIHVDIYGNCGNLTCPRIPITAKIECFDNISRVYFFYLSLENAYCSGYSTEKVLRALNMDLVPIVLGMADYEKIFPPHSFINVKDFSSPRHLADYLIHLSNNPSEYLEYINWKTKYPVQFRLHSEKKKGFCRLCEILHNKSYPYKTNYDIERYWSPKRLCIIGDEERKAVHLI